jgi:leucine dehydrogenase
VSAIDLAAEPGHEEVVLVHDTTTGLRAVIAIHDTTLGPAVGGTRMRRYASFDDAAVDALRLARAMTYKAVMAGMARGGGKAVIVGDPSRDKSRPLLAAYARALDRFDGRFQTGADMGFEARDIAVLGRMTKHVSHTAPDSKVDTADLAALGTFESIRAAARLLGRELPGLHVALQGVGQVGARLAKLLVAAGARLTLADVDAGRLERAVQSTGAPSVAPEAIYDVEADVFSPNAGGGILNDETLPRLRCRAVVGAANEQLAEPRHGDALATRGIMYAPDYVVNAGGLLSLLYEIGETDAEGVTERVTAIGARVYELVERSRTEGIAPHRLADRLVEEKLAAARAARRKP